MTKCRPLGPLLLDNHSWKQLLEERRSHAEEGDAPVGRHEIIDEISRRVTGQHAAPWRLGHALSRRYWLIAWLPSFAAGATALIKKTGLIYLCWGVPPYKGWRRVAFRLILARASCLLVQEDVTRAEIKSMIGRTAKLIPFFVDTDYFSYRDMSQRKQFLFCPGSNDRDPAVLLGLAELGYEIVWLVNDAKLSALYSSRHPRLQLRSRIPYVSLRQFYQTCAAVVLPMARDVHAAGQSTGLEALACGSPLLISRCRAASLFETIPSVSVVESHDPAVWSRALQKASERIAREPELTQIGALTVRKRNSYDAIIKVYAECIADVIYKQNYPKL